MRLILVAPLLAVLAVATASDAESDPDFARYLKLSPKEKESFVGSLPPERMISLYLRVMSETEPPELLVANYVASAGSSIVPVLNARLHATGKDRERMELISVFREMVRDETYAVTSDPVTMAAIQAALREMRDPLLLCWASNSFKAINGTTPEVCAQYLPKLGP